MGNQVLRDNEVNSCGSGRPFFTVIIATYNRAGLIKRALSSLAMQTESDWEAVVVDDGSTDNTAGILMSFAKGRNIRLIRQAKEGAIKAKNRGLRAAGGRFITFLDSDDEYARDHLRIRREILVAQPSVRFLYGGACILGNMFVPDRFDPSKRVNLEECVIGGTFVICRETALSLNGFRDLPFGSDADLFDRAAGLGVKMLEVGYPTYIYHHENPDSVTNRIMAGHPDRSASVPGSFDT